MTKREELLTWNRETNNPSKIEEEAQENEFNQVPVTDGDDILGLAILEPPPKRTLPESENYEEVSPEWLVSADTPIRKLIYILDSDQHPARFVFQENEIIGMVTYADLNRSISRTALYLLISQLEVELGEMLRSSSTNSLDYVRHLSDSREEDFWEDWEDLEEGDVKIDPVEKFYLTDLFRIARNESELRKGLGFPSKNQFDNSTSGINKLRRKVAHPVRPVIEQVDDIRKVSRRCKRTENLLKRVAEYER